MKTYTFLTFLLILLIGCTGKNSGDDKTSSAKPKQIEVIGLVPDISTKAQVEKASSENFFIIGGFKLICVPEYIEELLSKFLCMTGEKFMSRDTTTSPNELASNLKIHAKLLEGFTKKFGSPLKTVGIPLSNKFGVTVNSNIVEWIDQNGNKLSLVSILDKADEGAVIIQSAKTLKKEEIDKEYTDNQRKF